MSTRTLPESFISKHVINFRDEMHIHNFSLKAFGALLEYSNLDRFGDEWRDAGEYRGGLNRIVELITEQQERMVEDLVTKCDQIQACIIRKEAG